MKYSFVIKGRFYGDNVFPCLNNYLSEIGKHPMRGGKMKKEYMMIASNAIRRQLPRVHIDKPVHIHYVYYEANKKRDPSNIAAMGAKVIEDALQQCNVLPNDGWANIAGFSQEFHVDKENPRIEVYLEEIEEKEIEHE